MFFRILVISMVYLSVTNAQQSKLKLGVFYETLCPDSKNFIVKQLWPAYNSFGSHFDIDLVPFGNANYTSSNGKLNFTCEHGPPECAANMMQACAKDVMPNFDEFFKLVHCMEKDPEPHETSYQMKRKVTEPGHKENFLSQYSCQCGQSKNISLTEVNRCLGDGRGDQQLKKMGDLTKALNPKATSIPWLTLNGAYDSAFQTEALVDLKSALCKKFQGTKPTGC
ncbi:gamma-interferon-inducible lysosomal thiol reductase-like [Brevipalpus obovatus]|uniref:gamma-interferon-inducible lysosomal thiol reductase-like n=1 Tax=Brevipalpus obovatus TaxID=246614 RepID=UPI003D9F3F3D